eukprot:385864-Prymnesium_polylepis.1
MVESGMQLDKGELYTVTEERAEELVNQQDNIELAIADERRRVPNIAVDYSFWSVVDNARDAAILLLLVVLLLVVRVLLV